MPVEHEPIERERASASGHAPWLTTQRKAGLFVFGAGMIFLIADTISTLRSVGEAKLRVDAAPLAVGMMGVCFGALMVVARVDLGGELRGRKAALALAVAVATLVASLVAATQLALFLERAGYHFR